MNRVTLSEWEKQPDGSLRQTAVGPCGEFWAIAPDFQWTRATIYGRDWDRQKLSIGFANHRETKAFASAALLVLASQPTEKELEVLRRARELVDENISYLLDSLTEACHALRREDKERADG